MGKETVQILHCRSRYGVLERKGKNEWKGMQRQECDERVDERES